MISISDSVWLVTGCSKGFGRVLVEQLLPGGARVAASARGIESLDGLGDDNDRLLKLALDVNREEQIAAAVAQTLDTFGRIDVLVNNAGYGLLGAVEEVSEAEARAQMETNFFGALRCTQAVLPAMRVAGRGHILQISSMAGLVGTPGLGLYNASKFALEGLSEALAAEVAPLGIRVTLIEPGPFRTDWAGPSMHHAQHRIDAYADTAHRTAATITGYSGKQPGDPARAAATMIKVVESDHPPLRLPLGAVALARIEAKLDRFGKELERWESVSRATDFADRH